jgi:hypothetical protein
MLSPKDPSWLSLGDDCGAASLSMVYRSFGKDVAQAQIWPAIGKQNRFGSFAATTHLMAQDALRRGFAAVGHPDASSLAGVENLRHQYRWQNRSTAFSLVLSSSFRSTLFQRLIP